MAYTNAPMYSLDQTNFTRVTRKDEDALAISFPTETELPEGVPVKFDSNGKIVAAENAMPIGIIQQAYSPKANQSVREGHCTVMVYGFAEVPGITTNAAAAGAELKYVGIDTATTRSKYTVAVQGDYVVALAGEASGAGALNDKVVMLYVPYKKP